MPVRVNSQDDEGFIAGIAVAVKFDLPAYPLKGRFAERLPEIVTSYRRLARNSGAVSVGQGEHSVVREDDVAGGTRKTVCARVFVCRIECRGIIAKEQRLLRCQVQCLPLVGIGERGEMQTAKGETAAT